MDARFSVSVRFFVSARFSVDARLSVSALPVNARIASLVRLAMVAAIALAAGCATTGGAVLTGGVGGFYAGSLVVDGRSFGAAVNLRSAGASRVEGVFSTSSPIEIEGAAEGAVVDDLLRLSVDYRTTNGCDGRIEGILDVTREGDALEGPVTLSDCDEPVAGRLILRRRDRGP